MKNTAEKAINPTNSREFAKIFMSEGFTKLAVDIQMRLRQSVIDRGIETPEQLQEQIIQFSTIPTIKY